MEEEISLENIEKSIERLQAMRDKCIYCGEPREKGRSHLWTGDCVRILKERVAELEALNEELGKQLSHQEFMEDSAYDAYRERNG